MLLTQFKTCPPYFKVESKITCDFAAQCSMFTYSIMFSKGKNSRYTFTRHQLSELFPFFKNCRLVKPCYNYVE